MSDPHFITLLGKVKEVTIGTSEDEKVPDKAMVYIYIYIVY